MIPTITPIETTYKGWRFRSRSEARWAVFMDSLGVRFLYEPEGFKLESGVCYLPDFFLTETKTWLEIKNPAADPGPEKAKVHGLVALTQQRAVMFYGPPTPPDPGDEATYGECYIPTGPGDAGWDSPYFWCECPLCGSIDIQFCGFSHRNYCQCVHEGRIAGQGSERLINAFNQARGCRFD